MTALPSATEVRPIILALAPPAPGIVGAAPTPGLEPLGGSLLVDRLLGSARDLGLPSPLVITRTDAAEPLRRAVSGRAAVHEVAAGRREALVTALEHSDEPFLLVHDAERALTPAAVVSAVLAALAPGVDAVVPTVAMTDSVKQIAPSGLRNVDRSTLAALQSPRLLRREALVGAVADAPSEGFDEIQALLDRGAAVCTVQGSHAGTALVDRLTLWQAQISLGLARDTSHRHGLARRP